MLIPILLACGGIALGLALGFAIRRNRETPLRLRVHELEEEIDKLNVQHTVYRSKVGQHMSETGDLLKNLALNLCDTYEHIAGGAQELCPNEIKSLRPGHAAEELLLVEAHEPAELSFGEPLNSGDTISTDPKEEKSASRFDDEPEAAPEKTGPAPS
jgi:uncharacterized membrane-anchored protein YhcB (DUF1043 family)